MQEPGNTDDALEAALEVLDEDRVDLLVDRDPGGRVRDVDEHAPSRSLPSTASRTGSVMSISCVCRSLVKLSSCTTPILETTWQPSPDQP